MIRFKQQECTLRYILYIDSIFRQLQTMVHNLFLNNFVCHEESSTLPLLNTILAQIGGEEIFVQTFNAAIDISQDYYRVTGSRYRSTPHSVTKQSPSELLNGRRICTRLDLIHPCQFVTPQSVLQQKEYYDAHMKPKEFVVSKSVWIKNFRADKHWLPGLLRKMVYEVSVEGTTMMWNRHAN